jgi:hypothetical protein
VIAPRSLLATVGCGVLLALGGGACEEVPRPDPPTYSPIVDAGDEAFAHRAVVFLWGRRPLGIHEIEVLTDLVEATDRSTVASAMARAPEGRDHWRATVLDLLGMPRLGGNNSRLCALALFFVSTQPGIFRNSLMDVFEQTNVQNHSLFALKDFGMLTFELSNPFLYAPMLLWLVPGVRAREPRGLPLAVALGAYVGATLFLQGYGLALGSTADEPHHYFEMIDPMVAACSVWALAAAWEAYPHKRGVLKAGVVGLACTQLLYLGRTLVWIYDRAHG